MCIYIYVHIYLFNHHLFFFGGGLLVLHGGATRIRRQLPAALAAKWRDHGDMERIRALNSQKSEKYNIYIYIYICKLCVCVRMLLCSGMEWNVVEWNGM